MNVVALSPRICVRTSVLVRIKRASIPVLLAHDNRLVLSRDKPYQCFNCWTLISVLWRNTADNQYLTTPGRPDNGLQNRPRTPCLTHP
jgi:hypothetical protein